MKGFSLIEGLITIAIFSLIFIAIFSIMNEGLRSWSIADVNIELQQDIRKGLMVMDRQLRQSRSSQVSIPADDNYYTSVTFKIPEDTDGDGDTLDSFGNIEWSGSITYSLNANKQLIRTTTDGDSVLANNITSLGFKRISGNPDVIEITITAQKAVTADKTSGVSIAALIKMRN